MIPDNGYSITINPEAIDSTERLLQQVVLLTNTILDCGTVTENDLHALGLLAEVYRSFK